MGAVYLARDTQLDRPVALKVPFLGGSRRRAALLRPALQARPGPRPVHHPNICPVYDVGEIDGTPYLTMAYVDGKPLSRRVARGPLRGGARGGRAGRGTGALHDAHERGVIHRDLKPANVMIDEHGEPVVMDFGIAHLPDSTRLTRTGLVMGTPGRPRPRSSRARQASGAIRRALLGHHGRLRRHRPLAATARAASRAVFLPGIAGQAGAHRRPAWRCCRSSPPRSATDPRPGLPRGRWSACARRRP